MTLIKTSTIKTWWSCHLSPVMGLIVAVAGLAGVIGVAVVQTSDPDNQASLRAQAKEAPSATGATGSDKEVVPGTSPSPPESPAPTAAAPAGAGEPNLNAVGGYGGVTKTFTYPFNVQSDESNGGSIDLGSRANLGCSTLPPIKRGESASTRCNFQTSEAFKGSFTNSCEVPAGMTCLIDHPISTPVFSSGAEITATVTASLDAPLGRQTVVARGESPGIDDGPQPRSEILVDVLESTDYSLTCGSPGVTVQEKSSAQLSCEVRAGNFKGPLNVAWLASAVSGGPPTPVVEPSRVQLMPNASAQVVVTFDATSATPGMYTFHIGALPDGALNAFLGPDTDKTKTVIVEVVPAPAADASQEPSATVE